VIGRLGTIEQTLEGRQKIVGDGAADAAIGELDDVVVLAALYPAAEQQLAVDAELAEFVDDERETPPAGACSTRWRTRLVLPAPRKPVTMVAGIFFILVPRCP